MPNTMTIIVKHQKAIDLLQSRYQVHVGMVALNINWLSIFLRSSFKVAWQNYS